MNLRIISSLMLAGWSIVSLAHDLIGIDAERERKAKLLESLASAPPAPPRAPAPAPPVTPLRTTPAKSGAAKLSGQDVQRLKVMINRDQAIAVAKNTVSISSASGFGIFPEGTQLAVRSVINDAKTWKTGTNLQVCFYDGSDIARGFVKVYATRWTDFGNVAFDFGPAPSYRNCVAGDGSVIRVTFAVGGYASYVGDDSLLYAKQNMPTLFLQQLDQVDLAQDRYKSVVIHEFGHALGFEHEHQSPMSACEQQFDLPAIEVALGWNEQKAHANFDEIRISKLRQEGDFTVGTTTAGTTVTVSKYDPKSVMHYALPASYFIQPPGDCFIPLNADLSDRDQKAMAATYPYVDATTHIANHNARIDSLLQTPNLTTLSKESLKALRK